MKLNNNRPVYLDVLRIHMPVAAVVSILHRISGVLLFLAIPLVIYLLQLSLRDAQGFAQVRALLQGWPMRALLLLLLWALLHHFFAGIRYLLADLHIGVGRSSGRHGAWAVFAAELIALGLIVGWTLL